MAQIADTRYKREEVSVVKLHNFPKQCIKHKFTGKQLKWEMERNQNNHFTNCLRNYFLFIQINCQHALSRIEKQGLAQRNLPFVVLIMQKRVKSC